MNPRITSFLDNRREDQNILDRVVGGITGFAQQFGNMGQAVSPPGGNVQTPPMLPGPDPRQAALPTPQGGPQLTPQTSPDWLVQSESSGRWNARNNEIGAGGLKGHFGRIQFGQARLNEARRAGVVPRDMSPEAFARPENAHIQQAAEQWHWQDINKHIADRGLDRYVGQTIHGVPVTREAMHAVAHLGGKRGLERYLETGGRYNPADAYGTHLSAYHARAVGASPSGGNALMTMAARSAPAGTPAPPGYFADSPLLQETETEEEPSKPSTRTERFLHAFFSGLGPMSRGQDFSGTLQDVFKMHAERQEEARQRMKEIAEAKRTREGREQFLNRIYEQDPDLARIASSSEEGFTYAQEEMTRRAQTDLARETYEFQHGVGGVDQQVAAAERTRTEADRQSQAASLIPQLRGNSNPQVKPLADLIEANPSQDNIDFVMRRYEQLTGDRIGGWEGQQEYQRKAEPFIAWMERELRGEPMFDTLMEQVQAGDLQGAIERSQTLIDRTYDEETERAQLDATNQAQADAIERAAKSMEAMDKPHLANYIRNSKSLDVANDILSSMGQNIVEIDRDLVQGRIDSQLAEARYTEMYGSEIGRIAGILGPEAADRHVQVMQQQETHRQQGVNLVDLARIMDDENLARIGAMMSTAGVNFGDALKAVELSNPDTTDLKNFRAMENMSDEERQRFIEFMQTKGISIQNNTGERIEVAQYMSGDRRLQSEQELVRERRDAAATAAQMQTLLDAFGDELPVGVIEDLTLPLRNIFTALGFSPEEEVTVALQKSLQQLSFRMIPSVREPGQTSNYEIELYLKATPGLKSPALTNAITLQAILSNHASNEMRASEMENYLFEHGNLRGFDAHWRDMVDAGRVPVGIVDATSTSDQGRLVRAAQNGMLREGMLFTTFDENGNKIIRPMDQFDIEGFFLGD